MRFYQAEQYLFDGMVDKPDFDGVTYEPERDKVRLNAQLQRVFDVMRHGGWFSLEEIGNRTGDQLQSISARLRDFRKPKFGGHDVERRREGDSGLFKYRLVLNPNCEIIQREKAAVAA